MTPWAKGFSAYLRFRREAVHISCLARGMPILRRCLPTGLLIRFSLPIPPAASCPSRHAAPLCLRWLALAVLAMCTGAPARAQTVDEKWVGTWTVGPQTQEAFVNPAPPPPPVFTNLTLRQIVHTSVGGSQVRVRLSNTLGTAPLTINRVHLALRHSSGGARIRPASDRVLTFGGRRSVIIPAGALVVSDPVDLAVPALSDLAISFYLPSATAGTTLHIEGRQTNYILNGNQCAVGNPIADGAFQSYFFLTGVEVLAPRSTRVIVALGDSITDGSQSSADTNHRWPNLLAARLLAQPPDDSVSYEAGVLNQGIGGNRLLHDNFGPNALSRFDRDVLAQAGVTDVILLEGINDIGFGGIDGLIAQAVSAADIIAAYEQCIARAHGAGLRIYGATLTPFAGAEIPGYYSVQSEAKRQAVNDFVRTGGKFDGFVDFEAALGDGSNPPRLQPLYDSGDHLHPSDAGYQAMADAVDLGLFAHAP